MKHWIACSKFVNYYKFINQYNIGSLHNHFMALTLLPLKDHYSNMRDLKIP